MFFDKISFFYDSNGLKRTFKSKFKAKQFTTHKHKLAENCRESSLQTLEKYILPERSYNLNYESKFQKLKTEILNHCSII